MAGTPKWKVYNSDGEYIAAFKYAEDAAVLVGAIGEGTTIRHDHSFTAWTEGREAFSASDSYDRLRDVVTERVAGRRTARR